MNKVDLSQDEIDSIFRKQIIPQIIGDISPQPSKKAFILGGQPGSGKSTLVREILKPNNNTVFINGDDLRPYHPKYYSHLKENDQEAADLTQPVCNLWVEALIRECMDRGLNLIVEGTMRTKEVPLSTAQMLKKADYSVDLVVVSAPYELSLMSLEYRYEEIKRLGGFARYTKKESHDEAYKNIEGTLRALSGNGLFHRFRVYLRTPQGFKENIFEPEQRERMMEVFNAGRDRPLEDQEKKPSHFKNPEATKYIFDFDDVLFNTTAQFKKLMFRVITEAGVPEGEAEKYYLEVREKEFSLKNFIATLFSRYGVTIEVDQVYETIMKESANFVNTELSLEVQRLGKDNCYIVTNGNQEFNGDKIKYSGIGKLFHEQNIHIVPGSKGAAVKSICDENRDSKVVFIDDKLKFFSDIKDCPNLRTILYKGQPLVELKREIETKRHLIPEIRKIA
jgi:UDP-N-acetylglucosamine kinase